MSVDGSKGSLTVRAYRGDAKTLLAFNLDEADAAARKRLAGFTVQVAPPGREPYYLQNNLRFEHPEAHAQLPSEPSVSSINAPIHKFRWVHVPGQVHQGIDPAFGDYTYTVTPRYFDSSGSLQPLDKSLSVAVTVTVAPFEKDGLRLGFTRGYTQSQAFVRHFGLKAAIKPRGAGLLFDVSQVSGTNAEGTAFTFQDEYRWLGFTARARIFDVLDEVAADKKLSLDVFAYDLNEPDFVRALLELATQGRVRVMLDDADLHHPRPPKDPGKPAKTAPEDEFETLFRKAAKGDAGIVRGHFQRYAHDKVLIVRKGDKARKVLTGSTNFSVTGLYVNSNHVLVFEDAKVAQLYGDLFQKVWDDYHALTDDKAVTKAFRSSPLATEAHAFESPQDVTITFSPHTDEDAGRILNGMIERVGEESSAPEGKGSVLFAVMQLDGGKDNPVYDALRNLHANAAIFSFGISDASSGISLYKPGSREGLLVTGKPGKTQLPPPFSQVPDVGLGHQVHHKFIVCGFNRPDAVVYCGSSNLALAGEEVNGDNLLAIRDCDVATAFAIEALALVDHFNFLDRLKAAPASDGATEPPPALKQQAAAAKGWFLGTTDAWVAPYYDGNDLRCVDRRLFG